MSEVQHDTVDITKEYYDSKSADEFYHTVWGGEDIHIGLYQDEKTPILEASKNTVRKMADTLDNLNSETTILDIGAGYGGAARYLAATYGCKVTCLNLSEVENERNREKNRNQGLDNLIHVVTGNFEALPFKDETFDVVWSEDAILHSGNKLKVFEEAHRVLKNGGTFIFTDPMQADDCPEGVLQPILDRIHLTQMGSVKLYKEFAAKVGLSGTGVIEMPGQLINHYAAVLNKLGEYEPVLLRNGCDTGYIVNMKKGLKHWIEGGKKNYLNWGIVTFEK